MATTAQRSALPKPGFEPKTTATIQKIRCTLTGGCVKDLEAVSSELCKRARNLGIELSGPVRLPTKTLRVPTRKTPCGEGSKTWDRYQMSIHKRILDVVTSVEVMRQMVNIKVPLSVRFEVTTSTVL